MSIDSLILRISKVGQAIKSYRCLFALIYYRVLVWSEGGVVTFEHDFCDHNLNDLSWWTDKHNRYATREVIDVLNGRYHFFPEDVAMAKESSLSQAGLKRFIKERIYTFLPVFSGPVVYFFYRYLLRLGFLDGKAG
ncbi:MAG: glycosyltransferase family 2 protein, partial [Maribacter sp.]|nr:glycosyltransferase family 2 protein [Maribacter sp.]